MISIIIPTYNHRDALQKCLASIAAQTYKDYEVIVVDDGSTDETWEWLQAVKNQESRIKNQAFQNILHSLFVIRNSSNQGANTARNRGLREAHGSFLLFCDADVIMQPQMLERMMRTLAEHAEASYVYSSFKFGWKTFRLFPFDGEKLRQMPYIHSTSLLRREHIPKGGWDESLKRLQDWDFFLTILEEEHTGVWIPEMLFTVAVRKGGISQWLPLFAYKIPWLSRVKKYKAAEAVIKKKHNLSIL